MLISELKIRGVKHDVVLYESDPSQEKNQKYVENGAERARLRVTNHTIFLLTVFGCRYRLILYVISLYRAIAHKP
jgi:hypothetical protein